MGILFSSLLTKHINHAVTEDFVFVTFGSRFTYPLY